MSISFNTGCNNMLTRAFKLFGRRNESRRDGPGEKHEHQPSDPIQVTDPTLGAVEPTTRGLRHEARAHSAEAAVEDALLRTGLHDFASATGRDLEARAAGFADWVETSARRGLFQFLRCHAGAPDVTTQVTDWGGNAHHGLNLASQDYLGLARHPRVVEAFISACKVHGTHSSGSEPMGGGLADARALEKELGELTRHSHVVLFPTGWAAGYGAIRGIVRPYDHVLMDSLAHNCLQHGASASTPNVSHFVHNDIDNARKRLAKIRSANPDSAILLVTESLFSMDSDHPDFNRLLDACREHGAFLMVDCAHDLGLLGPDGRGVLGEQGVLERVDFLVGSFSKSFACIGGFFASRSSGSAYQVRGFSGSYTFSNYLIPAQVAAVRAALGIISSAEGQRLREATIERCLCLRRALERCGVRSIGRPSAMVIVPIGSEASARRAYRHCLEHGVIVNCIEFPACRRDEARFRLQVTPQHTREQLERAAEIVAQAIHCGRADDARYDPIAAVRSRPTAA